MSPIEIEIDADTYRGDVLLDGFGPDLSGWWEEGLGHFSLDGDVMLIDAREGGYTAFWKTPLPADMLVRYRVKSLPPFQQNNFNLISHCAPPKPGEWPVVELGRYPGYRAFGNYIATFVGDWERDDWGNEDNHKGRVRFRRNPGFDCNREQYPDSPCGQEYEITYAVQRGVMRYYVNGVMIDEWQDPEPLDGGLFAFRTFCTVAEYRAPLFVALK
jgi:hypothetical protein